MLNAHSNLATFNDCESMVTPYAMAYWRIWCSYILTYSFHYMTKPSQVRLSTDFVKGELNPKIKFILFERTLKITE